MQLTNYGLGGLVENHNDPYGYNEGVPLTPDRWHLAHTGGIIATLMIEEIKVNNQTTKKDKWLVAGWLSDTTAGGATSFYNGLDLVSH